MLTIKIYNEFEKECGSITIPMEKSSLENIIWNTNTGMVSIPDETEVEKKQQIPINFYGRSSVRLEPGEYSIKFITDKEQDGFSTLNYHFWYY